MEKLKVLVVGCGNMGTSHARAYHQMDGFEIVGLVSRKPESREVSINTYPDTHYEYVKTALKNNAHVFVEKPLALTVADAQELVDLAIEKGKKMVVGYILRVHPAWAKFVDIARTLGKPLVMRMNLNQQSSGDNWYTHK